MVMPVATPTANVPVNRRSQNFAKASSCGSRERYALVCRMAKIRPNPIESGTNRKWNSAVAANCMRASVAASKSASMCPPFTLRPEGRPHAPVSPPLRARASCGSAWCSGCNAGDAVMRGRRRLRGSDGIRAHGGGACDRGFHRCYTIIGDGEKCHGRRQVFTGSLRWRCWRRSWRGSGTAGFFPRGSQRV